MYHQKRHKKSTALNINYAMKKMLNAQILLGFLFLLTGLSAGAQGGWVRNYPMTPDFFTHFYRVTLATDGGYTALGFWNMDTTTIHLFKTDADGAPQWEVVVPAGDTMNSTDLFADNDGSYLLARGTQKAWNKLSGPQASLLRLGGAGNIIWRKNYFLGQSAAFQRVKTQSNGQIMAVGEVYQNATYHGLIARMDAAGTLLDTANISLNGGLGRVTLTDFFEKSDGSFLASGKYLSNDFNVVQTFWVHLDNDLNVLETKILDNTYYTTVARFSANGTLFLAKINVALYELLVDKISPEGALSWQKNFTNQWGINIGQSEVTIDASPDGGCVLALGDLNYAVVKLDEDGNETWSRTLSTPNENTRKVLDIRATPDNGCIACGYQFIPFDDLGYLVKIDGDGKIYSNVISGRMVSDNEQNCTNDATDQPLPYRVVKATGATDDFYATTNANGLYTMDVPPGTYLVHSASSYLGIPAAFCTDSVTVNLPNSGDVASVDFTDTLPRCPSMEVSLSTLVIRPCFPGTYNGQLVNIGTDTAFNAYVVVTLDDLLTFSSSTPAATDVSGQAVRVDFGTIPPGEYRFFQVHFFTDCNAPLGYTHCTEAHVYPDSSCLPVNGQWGGASLVASAVCDGDSVAFKIQNVGTGTMLETAHYIVIEDDMIQRQSETPQLPPGEFLAFSLAADGSTYRLEVEQEPFHPGFVHPSAVEQGCNAGVLSTGFVNLFPTPDEDPWIDIDCRANVNSFDPNSKEAYPLGYGNPHWVEANTALEYTLHFQNTGTAEAITVVLKDTIEETLDLLSIQPGVSSHPYTWAVTGRGVLTFRFDQIFLPDSNTNEPGSKGFVTFFIRQKPNLPLGTVIHNNAAIYFDYNAPIITNQTEHTIGADFVPVAPPTSVVNSAPKLNGEWLVSPNPARAQVTLSHPDIPASFFPLRISVTDVLGRQIHRGTMSGNGYSFERGNLSGGVYLYEIATETGVVVGQGKISFCPE